MTAIQLAKRVRETTGDTIIVGDGLMLRRRRKQWMWSVRYRASGHRPRVTLGKFPRVSLSKARHEAAKVLRRVDVGEDPQAAERAAKAAAERAKRDSIQALADAYLAWAKKHKKSWRKDQTMLTREIVPKWKGRAVTSIARRDCRALVEAVAKRGPTYATAVARLLSKMFNYAVDEEWITASPATRVIPRQRPDHDHEEQEAYSPDEIRRIWANTKTLPPSERAPIRIGFYTGQRPTEISDMQWPELNGQWWRIPGARTKNGRARRVYLAQQALAELATIPRIEDEPYVFVGRRGPKQLGAVNVKAFAGVTPREKPRHALRHTVGTGMASIRVSRDDRAKVLNHVDQSVTGIYDEYEYDKEKRLALTKWARRLQQILDAEGKRTEQKVVKIR